MSLDISYSYIKVDPIQAELIDLQVSQNRQNLRKLVSYLLTYGMLLGYHPEVITIGLKKLKDQSG